MGLRDKASQWAKQNILSSKQEPTRQGQQSHIGGVGSNHLSLSNGGNISSAKELHFQVSQKCLYCEVLGHRIRTLAFRSPGPTIGYSWSVV